MSRRLSPRGRAIEDRVAKVLADEAGFPLGTGEICRRLGSVPYVRRTIYKFRCPDHLCGQEHVVVHEHACSHRAQNADVAPSLKRLERAGVVERIVLTTHREHYWRWTDGAQREALREGIPKNHGATP